MLRWGLAVIVLTWTILPRAFRGAEKGIYNSESAEDVDFEFAPDSVKRQYLQGAGRQDSLTEVKAAGARKHRASCVQAGRSPDTLMANADSHCNAPTKGVIAQKCRRMRSQLRC